VGFDLFGGAVCNATDTTKAWYRSGQNLIHRFLFILAHLPYIALVACLWRGPNFDFVYFTTVGGTLIMAAAIVLALPDHLMRPGAFAAYLAALIVVTMWIFPVKGLEWFAPTLLLKLLIGHLVSR
jgi:hypothetical protein